MIIKKINNTQKPKLINGSMPDIDQDFASDDRAAVKKYMEERFGETQVCSIGTNTTFQVKGLIKDLARISSVDFAQANLITSIITKDDVTYKDVIKRALTEPKLKDFIQQNSDIFNAIPSLINGIKGKSIHACGMIIFPDTMKATEWLPMRRQKGLIVSEWTSVEVEDAGFLKEDILGITQLSKFDKILDLIERNNKERPDIYNLPYDSEVYRYFGNGWNGDVFQFGTDTISEYTKLLKPQVFDDLVAVNAIYRPGPLENGFHIKYVKCKNEGATPSYFWGTEEITKDTFGLLIYQEQIIKIVNEVAGLSLKDADDVRRAMGKKNIKYLLSLEGKIKDQCIKRGATESEFKELWETMIEFAKYSFNKSHAVCYAKIGYASQYLKVNFPIEYWTVSLGFANEDATLNFLSEILQAKKIKVLPPSVNESGVSMRSDLSTSQIFWGIESIKGIGENTAMQIIDERNRNGEYKSFADFFFRHNFKGSKVKKQTYEALIAAGAFDILYNIGDDIQRRNFLINRYRKYKKVRITNSQRDAYTIGEVGKKWWWGLQQKKLTGLSTIDYEALCETEGVTDVSFLKTKELNELQNYGLFRAFGGYIVECKIGRSKRGPYARLTLEHNYKIIKVTIWSEEYALYKDILKDCEKRLLVFTGEIKAYKDANQFTIKKNSRFVVL